MTFYLSRFVRDDVTMEQFMDGLLDFLKHSMRDPQNNIGELDKSLRDMLEHKLLCSHNPRAGLMFLNPSAASYIFQHPFLMQLLFFPRVFSRKHEWPTCYLSPISRHLCQQNLFSKLPSIYKKYGREIDSNRNLIFLSTIDYFFLSFIAYPIIVGRDIPKILNALYSSYKYEQEVDSLKSSSSNNVLFEWLSTIFMQNESRDDKLNNFILPTNPFKQIHFHYAQIFGYYVQIFLPQRVSSHSREHNFSEFSLKFIEIVGELWFGASFAERPIGDRCHTLPLMQDVLFVIMRRQIEFIQYEYQQIIIENNNNSISSSSTSCICRELRCLLRYLYSFFRESFEHFPLDFIANLRLVIEMFAYVLAPWSIDYKLRNPDENLARLREKEREQFAAEMDAKYRSAESKKGMNFLFKFVSKFLLQEKDDESNENHGAYFASDGTYLRNINLNDDRLRDLSLNNTEFRSAEALINYELEGIESLNLAHWKQYIMEMLPFYSNLIHPFIDTLLKYDFGHPLKQLAVLKIFHIYANPQIISLISDTEDIVFNTMNSLNNKNMMSHNDYESISFSIVNNIQDITFRSINEYQLSPFRVDPRHPFNILQNSNYATSIQLQAKAHQLYAKCRKVIMRLSPKEKLNSIQQQTKEEEEEEKEEFEEIQSISFLSSFLNNLNFTQQEKKKKKKKNMQFEAPQAHKMAYFLEPSDNIKIIRYISGELESLFQISAAQQENLCNLSIMFEPSQSISPQLKSINCKSSQKVANSNLLSSTKSSASDNIWNQPKGEFESFYALKMWQFLYHHLIEPNQSFNTFYLKYLAIYHRKYTTDIRAIAWYSALAIAKLFCHFLIFYTVCILFLIAIAIPYCIN